ncbi:MAG: cyclic nucleotide-binding domain-containing protein, partial [Proteobacteria bacterium]
MIDPQKGESFEVPAAYLSLFEAAERGASLFQMTELIQNTPGESPGALRFERLRRFLLFLNEHDLIADRGYQRLAESLATEFTWPVSLASFPIIEIPIVEERANPTSYTVTGELLSSVLVMVASLWAITVLPLALNAQVAEHITGQKLLLFFALSFWGGRSVLALFTWIVPFFAGYRAKLALALQLSGFHLGVEQRGNAFSPLTLLSLTLALGSVALIAKLASSQLDAVSTGWLTLFALMAFLTESSPFAKSALTDILKSAYAKSADEYSVRTWHVAASYLWTALVGLTSVLVLFPAAGMIFTSLRTASGLNQIGFGFVLIMLALMFVSWLIDIFSAFSYDEKTGASMRRLWSKGAETPLDKMRSSRPSTADLEKLPFLRQIESSVREKLIELSDVLSVEEGEAICRQGETDRSLFVVLQGRLAVAKSQVRAGGSRRRKIVAFLDAGAVFGEAAFFFGQARTADVVAMENSRVLKIPHIAEMKTIDESKSSELQARIWFLQALMTSKTFKELPSESLDAILLAGSRQVYPAGRRVIQE